MIDFLVDKRGGTREQQEESNDLTGNVPFVLMYGLAISMAF